MVKVKCITNLDMKYFAGETYEITREYYEANKTCFLPIPVTENAVNVTFVIDDDKIMKTTDINTKADDNSDTAIDYESKTIPQLKEIADERKIEYANNILKADLIELLK